MSKSRFASIAACIVVGIAALVAGFVVLEIIEFFLDKLWFSLPETLGTPTLWVFVLALPTIAGVIVVWLRKTGNDGHNPLFGISMKPVNAQDYPSIIGGIFISLVGGLVLGPEAAMVCTGAVVGSTLGARMGLETKTRTIAGITGAIVALFINPILHGTFSVASDYQFRWFDLVGAVITGIATCIAILVCRWIAIKIMELPSLKNPNYAITPLIGLIIGLLAMIYHTISHQNVELVMTSGESNVKHLVALGSVGAILLAVLFKWIGYSLSMGGGFRGGPFFPAIFIGIGLGAAVGIAVPDMAHGSGVAGLTAAVIYLAHPKWPITLALAIVLALIGGGPALIPISILAAVIAKLIPEFKPKEEASTPKAEAHA